MTTLICGSIAFDNIMVFQGRFAEHILPEQVHILNVAFLVPEMRREFGGTAGNIAYNLKLLGSSPTVMATVGDDAKPYLERLEHLKLDPRWVKTIAGSYTAQAFITTDLDDNQITAFHPGAMSFSHENRVADVPGVKLGIVAPDGRDGMIQHAREFAEAKIPFIFDPGQGLPMFNGEELLHFIGLAPVIAVNDYEAKLLSERTRAPLESLARDGKVLVVTRGGNGSDLYVKGEVIHIPVVPAEALADPTGCGDAYRAGLLYGMAEGLDWPTTGRLASTMGSIKIASRGPQNHRPSRDEIAERFKSTYGYRPF